MVSYTIKHNVSLYLVDERAAIAAVRRKLLICFFISVACLICRPGMTAWAEDVLDVGFSSSMFIGVNQNDALASVKAWTEMLAEERDISGYADPRILTSISEIREVIEDNTIDCLAITTEEYYHVREILPEKRIILGKTSNNIFEKYLILVRGNSGIETLGDLKDKRLIIHMMSRNTLAPLWLDTLLMRNDMKPLDQFFGRTESEVKLGKVIIPVFFGQADACLVARKGFDITTELNPQVGRELKVISSSPDYVPSFFIFSGKDNSGFRKKVSDELKSWHKSPAGKQSLTIFQADSIVEKPINCLDSALGLIAEHKRLLEGKNGRK